MSETITHVEALKRLRASIAAMPWSHRSAREDGWIKFIDEALAAPDPRQSAAEALAAASQALADAMETCHECKGTVLVEEQPTHCEDCSWNCESHEGAECPTIYSLHLSLKMKLAAYEASK